MKYLFLVHAIQWIVTVAECCLNPHIDEMYGSFDGFWQAIPVEETAGNDTSKGVSGAGIIGGHVVAAYLPQALVASVVGKSGYIALISGGGLCDDAVFWSQKTEFLAPGNGFGTGNVMGDFFA